MAGRLKKELKDFTDDTFEESGVTVRVVGTNLTNLMGIIKGPGDTPFEGGVFNVEIIIPERYPFEPPKMKFSTRLWHPNISSQTGAICLDILKDRWTPALTLKTTLISLQALLSTPVPEDPQDAEVAKMYMRDFGAWKRKASEWTVKYAGAERKEIEDPRVTALVEMGFDKEAAKGALALSNSKEGAIEHLLSM
eukprot:TRINITY_DN777960_c0_g1_i1.p1 TRINITY_DN777960_c0_g1~~TRINITY_DN777960_c0_g1_i1.p1  ORF type:complete len:194 (+),score=54.84 TRINITY_DN777960_c0_g1_i1:58-639(+)